MFPSPVLWLYSWKVHTELRPFYKILQHEHEDQHWMPRKKRDHPAFLSRTKTDNWKNWWSAEEYVPVLYKNNQVKETPKTWAGTISSKSEISHGKPLWVHHQILLDSWAMHIHSSSKDCTSLYTAPSVNNKKIDMHFFKTKNNLTQLAFTILNENVN